MLEQLLHRCQLLKQNILVPKNSCHHNSFFAQGRFEQCELHFYLSYSRLPEILHISEGSIPTYEYGPTVDAPPKPCFLFVEQDHAKFHQDVFEVGHKRLFSCILVSKPHGTCTPTLSDLSCLRCSLKPPSRDFEWSTSLEASSFFRNRQTFIVPRQSRGFT